MKRGLLSLVILTVLATAASVVPAPAAIVEVTQSGFTFGPQDVTINVGDTVRWIHTGGSHTVTSGDPASCTGDGLFNEPLNSANPIVEFTFDTPGVVPYFCIPHCGLAMNGSVTVENPASASDETSGRAGLSLSVSPNPFNPRATIAFELSGSEPFLLEIYDAAGRLIATLVDEELAAGSHAVVWDGRSDQGTEVPSGIYYARSISERGAATARLILVQ